MSNTLEQTRINGIDTEQLRGTINAVTENPAHGKTNWHVTTHWRGGMRSDTVVKDCTIGGERLGRDFTIKVDEPLQLCGTNRYANPQEYLLAAFNACMIVGYSAACALDGLELEELRIESDGDIDLRGFLGIRQDVKAGYDSVRYTVFIKGNGTPEQFEKVHQNVITTSPNRFNLATAIPLKTRLVLEAK